MLHLEGLHLYWYEVLYVKISYFKSNSFMFPGTGFGLSLILNVEQYEYMRGPQNDAGIKVCDYAEIILKHTF